MDWADEKAIKGALEEARTLAADAHDAAMDWKEIADEREALLKEACAVLQIAASYADYPEECPTAGMLIHAKDCQRLLDKIQKHLK